MLDFEKQTFSKGIASASSRRYMEVCLLPAFTYLSGAPCTWGLASVSLEPFGRVYGIVVWCSYETAGVSSGRPLRTPRRRSSVLFFGVAVKAK
jgi:hypothetical protein